MKFEEALKQLDDISKKLDDPSTTLDESLELFERGVNIASQCKKLLEAGQSKIVAIKQQYDKLTEVDINGEL